MRADQPSVLVVGATGAIGAAVTAALVDRGARVALIGRRPDTLTELAARVDAVTSGTADLIDADGVRAAVDRAAAGFGRLDGVVVATGVAAFGPACDEDDAVVEEVFAVNTLGPMIAIRAALPHLVDGGGIAVLSAVLADVPTVGMAAYSASKAALSAWLEVLRRELRSRKIGVLDARPPHLETGLADRALAGTPPKLPEGVDLDEVVRLIVDGLFEGRRELAADLRRGSLELR